MCVKKFSTKEEFLEFLLSNISYDKKNWKHRFTTNCYAYALGLDVRENDLMSCAYIPGNIGDSKERIEYTHIFTYPTLINNIYDDLNFMKFSFREILPTDETDIDEKKISLLTYMIAYEEYIEYLSDFHFLREGDDGTWYHKRGWFKGVNNKDSRGNIITDPTKCVIRGMDYKLTLALKKGKL